MKFQLLVLLGFLFINDLRAQMFYESFEDWTFENSILSPDLWEFYPAIDSNLLNVERVQSLSDGDYALTLRSNIPFFEGNLITVVDKELPFWSDFVKLKFTYRCIGEGECKIDLGQAGINSNGVNRRNIWRVEAGDSAQYSVTVDSISINPPFDAFKEISISASPVPGLTGQYGVSEFAIDSLVVESLATVTSISSNEMLDEVVIWPNPFVEEFNIDLPEEVNQSELQLKLYRFDGKLIAGFMGTRDVVTSELTSGLYFLEIRYQGKSVIEKVFKAR